MADDAKSGKPALSAAGLATLAAIAADVRTVMAANARFPALHDAFARACEAGDLHGAVEARDAIRRANDADRASGIVARQELIDAAWRQLSVLDPVAWADAQPRESPTPSLPPGLARPPVYRPPSPGSVLPAALNLKVEYIVLKLPADLVAAVFPTAQACREFLAFHGQHCKDPACEALATVRARLAQIDAGAGGSR